MRPGAGALLAAILPATAVSAASLARGPYLQLLTTRSVTIVWNTDTPAACSLVLRPVGGTATRVAGGTGTVCAIPVDGLRSGRYGYVPEADGTQLAAESVFHTDDPNAPFTFLAVGDSGSGDANQLAVRDRMLAIPADFVLHTGDMIYRDGAAADFDPRFFTPYEALIRTLVFWPCLGNHDWHTADGQPWRDAFYTPANNPNGSENYYSFDFGNAHFVVLDSNESTKPDSPQYQFLDHDLGASGAFWKFVSFHHTIYSSGYHGSNRTIRANLVPLFDRYAVDVVLMGHDHDYERTLPLRGNQVVEPGQGTVYITTGGGGAELRDLKTSNDFTAYAEAAFHVTRIAVDGKTLQADMVRVDGAVRDSVTLAKDAPPPSCPTDVDCDDGVPCTVEPCSVDGCRHDVVTLGAVAAGIRAGLDLGACANQRLPRFVSLALDRAARVVERAVRGRNPRQADRLATRAVARLSALARRTDASRIPGLAPQCAASLAAAITTAQSRGECVASKRSPIADTYIEAGGTNHGGATELEVDASPPRVTYLKFDLSAVTGGVSRAVLELHAIRRSKDGGMVYRVADSSWLEGRGDGRTAEAGLTWTAVDTNHNQTLDAGDDSPLVPAKGDVVTKVGAVSRGKVVRLNVTSAFQGGPGLYTLAIASSGTEGTAFASREHPIASWRPALRVVRAGP
jgi:hypothetical protein